MRVLATGPLATIQDLGRDGYQRLGVSRSGAFDRAALAAANRLVGNDTSAAGVEITLGGLGILFERAVTVALTGALCPGAEFGVAFAVAAGTTLRLGIPATGLRSYLAIRGGIDLPPVLGSRSRDTLAGLGPPPLQVGDVLPIGRSTAPMPAGHPYVVTRPRREVLRIIPGPRDDWFTRDSLAILTSAEWAVRGESDRVGVRLDGPALTRLRTDELPSEPMLPGALQVPPDGRPIVLGPDSPTTGGYPVIAVVHSADLDELAQARPGDVVRFRA